MIATHVILGATAAATLVAIAAAKAGTCLWAAVAARTVAIGMTANFFCYTPGVGCTPCAKSKNATDRGPAQTNTEFDVAVTPASATLFAGIGVARTVLGRYSSRHYSVSWLRTSQDQKGR